MGQKARDRKEQWLGRQLDQQRQKAGFGSRIMYLNHVRQGLITHTYYNRFYDLVAEHYPDVRGSVVIYCQNIADYYRSTENKLYETELQYADSTLNIAEYWLNRFANIAPPFKKVFIEFSGETAFMLQPEYFLRDEKFLAANPFYATRSYEGVLIEAIDATEDDDWRWELRLTGFDFSSTTDKAIIDRWAMMSPDAIRGKYFGKHPLEDVRKLNNWAKRVFVNGDGTIHSINDPSKKLMNQDDGLFDFRDESHCMIALLSLMFMNCKNIRVTDEEMPTLQQQRKGVSAKGERIYYKVLKLSNSLTRRDSENTSSETESLIPLHMVRGHFARYTEDAPLFGKFTGMFWRPAHVRGSAESGVVVKDYDVQAPVVGG